MDKPTSLFQQGCYVSLYTLIGLLLRSGCSLHNLHRFLLSEFKQLHQGRLTEVLTAWTFLRPFFWGILSAYWEESFSKRCIFFFLVDKHLFNALYRVPVQHVVFEAWNIVKFGEVKGHGFFMQGSFQFSLIPYILFVIVSLALAWMCLTDVSAKCSTNFKALFAEPALVLPILCRSTKGCSFRGSFFGLCFYYNGRILLNFLMLEDLFLLNLLWRRDPGCIVYPVRTFIWALCFANNFCLRRGIRVLDTFRRMMQLVNCTESAFARKEWSWLHF